MADPPQSFMKALFQGTVSEEMVFPYPQRDPAESDIVKVLVDNLHNWARDNFDAGQADQAGAYPEGTLAALADMGFFGLIIPEEHGGLDLGQTAYAQVFEALSGIDGSLPVTVGGHSSIGMKGLLLFGTPEQKAQYLPHLATGEMLAAFALTEPGSGSDAASIRTRAERQPDGTWQLNGQKIWITNGGIAQFFTVFAQTAVKRAGQVKDKISAFIVNGDLEGFSRGPEEHKLGIKASSTVPLYFDNVSLPADAMLGGEGEGFKVAMNILNSGRIGVAAGTVGGAKALLEIVVSHARERKQFGKAIGQYELVQEKIARMTMWTYVTESMVYLTTHLADRSDTDYSLESAICKVFASERGWEAVNDGLQVMGGLGYMQEYPFERVLRDSRINQIFEGTNEILRLFIALAGMQAPGEYLSQLGQSLRAPIKGFGLLIDYAVTRVKEVVTSPRLNMAHPAVKPCADQFSGSVERFHRAINSAIKKFGRRVVDRQLMLQRFADSAIELYGMAAVISRVSGRISAVGEDKSRSELDIARIYCTGAWYRIRRNLRMLRRHEDRPLRRLAKEVIKERGYRFPL